MDWIRSQTFTVVSIFILSYFGLWSPQITSNNSYYKSLPNFSASPSPIMVLPHPPWYTIYPRYTNVVFLTPIVIAHVTSLFEAASLALTCEENEKRHRELPNPIRPQQIYHTPSLLLQPTPPLLINSTMHPLVSCKLHIYVQPNLMVLTNFASKKNVRGNCTLSIEPGGGRA